MRLAHKYVDVRGRTPARGRLDETTEDFREANAYDQLSFETREQFLDYCETEWVRELREVLGRLLDKDRTVLSVGSGKGEHEVPLFLEGYDIVASEIVSDSLDDATRLFPGFRAIHFDVLDPPGDARYDDVLMTGIDALFDDRQLELALRNARRVLNPGGRVIFVLRYHDNIATRVIDRGLLPVDAALRKMLRRNPDGTRVVKKAHGYRRTRSELVALAEGCGYRVGRVEHAAFGMEWNRLNASNAAPRLQSMVKRMDRRLAMFNSATVFELLT